jgi:large repetitive protein
MQNFTLGKKGISMLLFTFILLIGSLPSYGQECPTVTASDQTFCDSGEPQVRDLAANLEGDGEIAWYADQTTTEALLPTEFLQNGTTYYAGTTAENCTGNRAEVNVTIFSQPEITGIRATTPTTRQSLAVLGICVADVNNPDVFVSDLRTNYDGVENVRVVWYLDRTSTQPLSEDDELLNNTDYYAGLQVLDEDDNGVIICETNRRRTSVRFYTEAAPEGDAEQQFCSVNNPTLNDIVASGTNRFYASATSVVELGRDTPLEDGEVYYVSSVGDFCESEDRLEVTVTVQDPEDLGTPETGIICEADVDETFPSIDAIRNYYLALLPEGVPTNGTFSPTPTQLANQYQNDEDGLGDFTTTYTVGIGECESSIELTATIVPLEEANAGSIEDVSVDCNDEELIVLADLPNDGGMAGGTFTGEGVDENGNFDPSVGPGEYTITYSVDDSSFCVVEGTEDSTTFTITVEGLEELPEAIAMEMCILEAQELLANPLQAEAFFNNLLTENGITNLDGDFNEEAEVTASEIYAFINSNPTESRTFDPFTYTIENECGVESVDIVLTINNAEEPNAGPIDPAPVCASTTPFDLYSLLGEDNDAGGTFLNENEEVIEDGLLDVSNAGPYTITYTVSANAEECTVGDDDETTFTLTVNEGAVAESPDAVLVCSADVQELFPSNDEIRKFYTRIAQQAGFPTNGTFNPRPRDLAAHYQADEWPWRFHNHLYFW